MKIKMFYIFIGMAALLLTGCKNNDQETYFIPTPAPDFLEEDVDNIPDDITDDLDDEAMDPDDPVFTGETTTKYVKLNTYGAILNVRSSPTTDEDNVVGFLVHTEPVEVISIEDNWASFMYKGEICYVSAEFLVDFVPPYISPPTLNQ